MLVGILFLIFFPPSCSCCPGTFYVDQAGLDSRDRVQASQAVRVMASWWDFKLAVVCSATQDHEPGVRCVHR